MDKKKLELLLEIVKKTPDVDTEKLLQLIDITEEYEQRIVEVQEKKINVDDQTIKYTDITSKYRTGYSSLEDTILIKNYRKKKTSEIAKMIGRTEKSVDSRIKLLKRDGKISNMFGKGWTEDEDEVLLETLNMFGDEEKIMTLAKLVSEQMTYRSVNSILQRMYKLKNGGY